MKKYVSALGSSPEIINIEEFKKDINKNIIFTMAMSLEAQTMSLVEGFDLDLIKVCFNEPVLFIVGCILNIK